MNDDAIYSKTQKGFDEMATRASHLAHRVRQVLLQVDGRTRLGELASRFSNALFVEEAVSFLAAEQFITTKMPDASEVRHEGAARVLSAETVTRALHASLSVHVGPVASHILFEHVGDDPQSFTPTRVIALAQSIAQELEDDEQRVRFIRDVSKSLAL